MKTTEIRITEEGEAFVPDLSAVPIVPGDRVKFFADPDLDTNLCMAANTAAILSPDPGLTVTIAAGDSKTFEFSAAPAGHYCILTQEADWPYPDKIACGSGVSEIVLRIQPGKPPHYSGPGDDTTSS